MIKILQEKLDTKGGKQDNLESIKKMKKKIWNSKCNTSIIKLFDVINSRIDRTIEKNINLRTIWQKLSKLKDRKGEFKR